MGGSIQQEAWFLRPLMSESAEIMVGFAILAMGTEMSSAEYLRPVLSNEYAGRYQDTDGSGIVRQLLSESACQLCSFDYLLPFRCKKSEVPVLFQRVRFGSDWIPRTILQFHPSVDNEIVWIRFLFTHLLQYCTSSHYIATLLAYLAG